MRQHRLSHLLFEMYYVVIARNIRMPYDFRKATSLIFRTIG